jgi:hypothetical protein
MIKHRRLLLTSLSILFLTSSILACGFLPTPEPTPTPTDTPTPTATPTPTPTPTPTLTPTPTEIPLPDMDTYANDAIGISMSYPADWEMEPQESMGMVGAMFSTVADFSLGGSQDGAGLVMIAIPLKDYGLSGDDVDELWDEFAESVSGGADVGESQSYDIGGTSGRFATIESTEDDYKGYVAMAAANDYAYIFVAVASPAESWEDYEAVLMAMLDSVEFDEPTGSSTGEGRTDVPIPPDADISLNMQEMIMYQVDGSPEDAVQFIENNWPDEGWKADTDNFLHAPSEGLLIYLKEGEMAMIAVTAGEGDDVGKTDVVILIAPQE